MIDSWDVLTKLRDEGYGLHFCSYFDGRECVEIRWSNSVVQGVGGTVADALNDAVVKLAPYRHDEVTP